MNGEKNIVVGVTFGLFMAKEIGKGNGKEKKCINWHLFMKIMENRRKGSLKVIKLSEDEIERK